MATRKDAATKLALKVKLVDEETGKITYGQRVFAHINPALSDEDAFSVGTELGALQSHEVMAVGRTDAAELGE